MPVRKYWSEFISKPSLTSFMARICGISLLLAGVSACHAGVQEPPALWQAEQQQAVLESELGPSVSPIPRPDHTVVVVLENHAFYQIIQAKSAPYFNQLAASGALFTQSFGATHPSQPNYLLLFSGSTQGIQDDNPPHHLPWSSPNLGAALLAQGLRFEGYSENLPKTGFTGVSAGKYVRRHAPWVYWQGEGPNQVPPEVNRPFADFPRSEPGFEALPELAFVSPNMDNSMHDGRGNQAIRTGDHWLQAHLDPYAQWAQSHNSLLILTFDEDNDTSHNQIATVFWGPMVQAGKYAEKIGHLNLLRTLEEMYQLPHLGQSAQAEPIRDCWQRSHSQNP